MRDIWKQKKANFLVSCKAVVSTGWQSDQIAFYHLNANPFIGWIAYVKIAWTIQYQSYLVIGM